MNSPPPTELYSALSTSLMAYFQTPPKPRAKLSGLTEPYQLLLKELITDEEPVPVPVDWAIENIFVGFSLEEFCERYHLEYEVVTYAYNGHDLNTAFYVFKFKTE